MRPKKRILIAGASEDRVGVLRFLFLNKGYAVQTAQTSAEAAGLLEAGGFELLLYDLPLPGVEQLLAEAGIPTIALCSGVKVAPDGLTADAVLWRGFSAAELVERVRVLTARKRGPKPVVRAVMPEENGTWRVA